MSTPFYRLLFFWMALISTERYQRVFSDELPVQEMIRSLSSMEARTNNRVIDFVRTVQNESEDKSEVLGEDYNYTEKGTIWYSSNGIKVLVNRHDSKGNPSDFTQVYCINSDYGFAARKKGQQPFVLDLYRGDEQTMQRIRSEVRSRSAFVKFSFCGEGDEFLLSKILRQSTQQTDARISGLYVKRQKVDVDEVGFTFRDDLRTTSSPTVVDAIFELDPKHLWRVTKSTYKTSKGLKFHTLLEYGETELSAVKTTLTYSYDKTRTTKYEHSLKWGEFSPSPDQFRLPGIGIDEIPKASQAFRFRIIVGIAALLILMFGFYWRYTRKKAKL